MRTSSTKNSLIIGISIVLGASLLSVGVSNAAGTTIKACAKKSNGAMRLIDVSKKCKKSERTLTWGTQGSAGATGATGATGAAGAAGATGATGAAGSNGLSKVHSYEFDSITALSFSPISLTRGVTLAALPAGSYALDVSAMVQYQSNTDHVGAAFLNCVISSQTTYTAAVADRSSIYWPKHSGFTRPYQISFQPSKAAYGQTENMSGSSVITVPGGQTLSFVCGMDRGRSGSEPDDEFMYMHYLSLIFTAVNESVVIGNG